MPHLRLLHWKASEAAGILDQLRKADYSVDYDEQYSPALMKQWRESPPDAFVIDLSRLPSHGREIAIALRRSSKMRHVPVVFTNGADEKIEKTRALLPDASYCTSKNLISCLKQIINKPVIHPVQPVSMMDRYGSRSVAQKLGVKSGSTIMLIDPPRDFAKISANFPIGIQFEGDNGGRSDVTLCFIHTIDDLGPTLSRIRTLAANTKLWILWRKKSSPQHAGVTEPLVRSTAIDLGLVDYKICSVSESWSAMAFARKK